MPPDISVLGIFKQGKLQFWCWMEKSVCEKWSEGEKKYEGRTTVRRRRVIIQGRQDPAATFLFLVDKGTLTHTIVIPSHFLYLFFWIFFVFISLSLACLLPPSRCLCLCHATMRRVWAPQPPWGAIEERQIRNGCLCVFVCLCCARPCGLFKSLLERHGS